MTLGLPLSTMYAFLLVLARVGGLLAFLPIPGFRNAPQMIRAMLAAAIAIALFPVWPNLPNVSPSIGQLTAWAFSEAGFGLAVGVAAAFLAEGFQIGTQVLAMQAGYGYASTIDPSSQADSSVLQVITMLMTGLLFFSTGLDRELMRVLAASFVRFPAGSWAPGNLGGILHLGAGMFTLGLRVAMPVFALLLLIDIALALLGRMQQQLQLLSLAFPMKMMAALALLAVLAPIMPKLFSGAAAKTLSAIWAMLRA